MTPVKLLSVKEFSTLIIKIFDDNQLNLNGKKIILLNCYSARPVIRSTDNDDSNRFLYSRSFAGKFCSQLGKAFPGTSFHLLAYQGSVGFNEGYVNGDNSNNPDVGEIIVESEQQILDECLAANYNSLIIKLRKDPQALKICLDSAVIRARILQSNETRSTFILLATSENDEVRSILSKADLFKSYPDIQQKLDDALKGFRKLTPIKT